MTTASKCWTEEEDDILIKWRSSSPPKSYKEISELIVGRTPRACESAFGKIHGLAEEDRAWSEDDISKLRTWSEEEGLTFEEIGKRLNRNSRACHFKYYFQRSGVSNPPVQHATPRGTSPVHHRATPAPSEYAAPPAEHATAALQFTASSSAQQVSRAIPCARATYREYGVKPIPDLKRYLERLPESPQVRKEMKACDLILEVESNFEHDA